MALIKEKQVKNFGVTASYWKVGMFTIDTNSKEINFSLNLYVSKEMASEKDSFIDTYSVTMLMGEEDKTLYNKYFAEDRGEHYKDWQTACYMFAKENVEFFKDAEDDEEYILETSKI